MISAVAAPDSAEWRLLRIYAWYRVALATMLLLLSGFEGSATVGGQWPALFRVVGVLYLVLNVTSLLLSYRLLSLHPGRRILVMVLIDIVALTLMIHASDTVRPHLTILIAVAVAAGNILLAGRTGAFLAAVATIAVIYEQSFLTYTAAGQVPTSAFTQVALLGIGFFIIAVLTQQISVRMRTSESLVVTRSRELAEMQRLNDQIIQRMRTGIVVVDQHNRVLLSNDAASNLLNLKFDQTLNRLPEALHHPLALWRKDHRFRCPPLRPCPDGADVNVGFAALDAEDRGDATLLFFEDRAQLNQQAQQLKLASLGRLTASIAHEIRNPLGAISHAAQLLAESEAVQGGDRRLVDIIGQHCRRVNNVIENVLQISRRQRSVSERFALGPWLVHFVSDLQSTQPDPADLIVTLPEDEQLEIRFDGDQLYQVLHNLVSNGLRYSRRATGHPRLWLQAGRLERSGQPYLDVQDEGPGISAEQAAHLFEPFYTTEATGTGLGIYLSRELCEANQARLDLKPTPQGACFRITFSHPDRLH